MVRKYLPPEKVMYKPKSRKLAQAENTGASQTQTANAAFADGSVDIDALFARFDNKPETVNLILGEVIKEGERKIPLLRELAESGDIKRYAVEAHGIKGSMSNSCIPHLSETAKAHELAAKEGNMKFVKDNVEDFLKEYNELLDSIKDYLKGTKS